MENIFVEFLPPWVETGLQPAFYDKESGTVLQQTARMYDRVNMLIRMFNKLSKETTQAFNELYNYVHDYFDNLDVQEEINNKLDAMAEAGTLQEIIDAYLSIKTLLAFDNVADMKAADNIIEGSYVETLGYYNVNDGGRSLYKIEKITNLITVDECEYIALNDDSLVAHFVCIDDRLNAKQFGCKGDNTTDDTANLSKCINYCNTNKITLYIPYGTFIVTTGLPKLQHGFTLVGRSRYDSTIKLVTDTDQVKLFDLYEQTGITIKDLSIETNKFTYEEIFDSQALHQIGIRTEKAYHCRFDNLRVRGFFEGFGPGFHSWCNNITNSEIYYCTNGILGVDSETNDYTISGNVIEYCDQGIRIMGGFGNHIFSNAVERCNWAINLLGASGTTIKENYFELNGCDLRVEDYTYEGENNYPTGVVSFTDNYIYVKNTTPRIKISTEDPNAICYVERNNFRASADLVSCTIFDNANVHSYGIYVAFNDNYVESPITIGKENNVYVKVNNSQKGNNSITAYLTSQYFVNQTAHVESIPISSYKQNGTNFTVENGGITVSRASFLRIGGKVDFTSLTAGNKIVRISMNGIPVVNTNTYMDHRGEVIIPTFTYSVSANTVIKLEVYANANDEIQGDASTLVSYLTVEEV